MATDLICPVCGEPATTRPPVNWTPAWGPRPNASHLDGEPLCPVVGERGYQPAQPSVELLGNAPDVDLPLERDRDELRERIGDEPIGYEAFPSLEDF